jgi:hypothetical protein
MSLFQFGFQRSSQNVSMDGTTEAGAVPVHMPTLHEAGLGRIIAKGWKKAGISGLLDGTTILPPEDPFQ